MNFLNPSTSVLIIAWLVCYTAATDADKFCEIQDKICDDNPHPLCNTFRADRLPNDLEHAVFYELNETEIIFILTKINRMRSIIARGDLKGNGPAANLRVVKWSSDYVRLATMKLKHVVVCTKISLTDEFEVETEQFRREDEKWDRNFYQVMLNDRIVNDSYGRSPWQPLFRAEFDTIGCVLYHDVVDESNMFECLTNKVAGVKEIPYKSGKPCTQCDFDCSKAWPNLCDSISSGFSLDDYQITVILILICIAVTIIFLAGMVYVFRLIINKKTEDLQRPDKAEIAAEILYSRSLGENDHCQINNSLT